MVYDVTDKNTFASIRSWVAQIQQVIPNDKKDV